MTEKKLSLSDSFGETHLDDTHNLARHDPLVQLLGFVFLVSQANAAS